MLGKVGASSAFVSLCGEGCPFSYRPLSTFRIAGHELHVGNVSAAALVALGLSSGLAIGLARIVAGCHFPSDVLWAAGFVFLVCHGLYVWLRPGWESGTMEREPGA